MAQRSRSPPSKLDSAQGKVWVRPTLLGKLFQVSKENTVALPQRAEMPVKDSIDYIERSSSICMEDVQPLRFPQEEVGSPRETRSSSKSSSCSRRSGSWERAVVTLAEHGRDLGQEVTAAARQRDELGRTAAENKARRREAARRASKEATERPSEREHDEQAAAARAEAAHEAAAAARERQAAARAEERAAEALAKLEAEVKVSAWCKENRYTDMHTPKKTFSGGTKFPMHTAVKHNSSRMISMMLLLGAQKDVKDSKMQTPIQLAAKLNNDGSHNFIIAMLQGFNLPSPPGYLLS